MLISADWSTCQTFIIFSICMGFLKLSLKSHVVLVEADTRHVVQALVPKVSVACQGQFFNNKIKYTCLKEMITTNTAMFHST